MLSKYYNDFANNNFWSVMNTTTDLPRVNKILGSFETVSEESPKFRGSEEEKNWIGKALADIKKSEIGVRLQERISHQVGTLSSFTPDQIIRLVSLLVQRLKQEPVSQEATNYLCQEVAALIIKKKVHSFENFLKQTREKNFAIQVLIQLVREGKLRSLDAVKDIQRSGIDPRTPEGQQALIEIAKLAAQQQPYETCAHIKNYGIDASTPEGQQALIEIAKLAAQHGYGISRYIKKYGIDASKPEGQKALIEIAKLAAQHCYGTSQDIKNYGIDASTPEGQQALIEIAKLEAKQNGGATSQYIKDYSIKASTPQGQQALIEIAKLAAQQAGGGTSQNIKNYGIDASTPQGQQALIEIAKLAAQQYGGGTSESIQQYGIDTSTPEGQQALIEIAKLAAQQEGWRTSVYIKNFGIDASTPQGRQGLIEIAKLAAQQDGWETSTHIKNYGIDASTPEGQQGLIEIAKLAAQQNGEGTSKNIKNYGLDASTPEGRQALIEIAKQAAQQNGGETSEYIKEYGIDASIPEGRLGLIEIAKLAAQQDGRKISQFIKNYGLDASTPEGRQALIEIAKLAAQQNGEKTSELIKEYGLDASSPEGRQGLIEIAKLAAQQNGKGTSEYIKNYGIKASTPDAQQGLIEIAKLAAQQNGEGTSEYIKNYGIKASTPYGQQGLIEIAKLAAQQNGKATYRYIKKYGVDAIQLGAALLDMDPADLQWVQKILSKSNKGAIQTKFLAWWLRLACLSASREDLKKLFREKPSVFERMSALSPELRTTLTRKVIASSQETKSLFLEALKADLLKEASLLKKITVLPRDLRVAVTKVFIRGCQGQHAEEWKNLKKESEDIAHARLACLILSQHPKGDYTTVLAKIKSDRSLRDAKHQQPLLEFLLAIKKCTLRDSAKIALVNKIFAMPDKERLTAFRLVTDILNFKGKAYLRKMTDFQSLKSAVEKLFVDKCKVQLDNFMALYENTVGTWRSKEALLTYAGKHVANPAVLPYFQAFLTAVLKDNFQTIRYATDTNPHLAEIEQHYPLVFENWKLSAVLKDDEVGLKDTLKAVPVEKKVVETLKQAVENQHLGLERQEALFPILAACKGKWKPLDKPLKLIDQQLAPLLNRRLSKEEMELKQRLLLQKAFLELIQEPGDLLKKLNILKGIK